MISWLALTLACQDDPIQRRSMRATPSEDFVGPITVAWRQIERGTVRVEYELDGEWRSTPERTATAGDVAMTVVGLPPEVSAPWRVVVESAGRTTVVDAHDPIVTRPLPASFPPLTLEIPDALERDDYLFTSVNERACSWCSGPFWSILTDRRGRVVWATKTEFGQWTLATQRSATGDHLLYDVIPFDSEPYAVRTWLDRTIETIPLPGHHHGFIELPDGSVAWGRWDEGSFFESIEERAPDGTTRTVFRCEDWPAVFDRCRSNSVEYDARRDVYWFSLRVPWLLVEVDRSTGDLLGFSDRGGPGGPRADEYTFDPEEALFNWQHAPRVLENGNLLVSTDDLQRSSTRVSEYAIDREERVLTRVWSYDPGVAARFNGDVLRTPEGTTLHALGATGVIYEVTEQGDVLWRIAFPDRHQVGRMALVDDLYELVAPVEASWP